MKSTLIILISLFVATSVAAFFNSLYFIPTVIFALIIGLTLFFERFLPDKSIVDKLDKRLKTVENVMQGHLVAKAMGKG